MIGRGGAGTVHLGEDTVLGRRVALKRIGLTPGADSTDLRRAEREARLAAALNHPSVVAVFDLVEEEDCHWLVMEYVDGQTMAQLVRADGPMDPTHIARLLAQTADALVEAHRAGIVHRDVKPSNILITAADEAKLSDFGIARASSDVTLTQTGLVTGSPAYLAPEVASGSSATRASDVWSLGATLFHAATGRPPYEIGGNLVGALYQIVHDEPPRLPPEHPLAGVLSVMMCKAPEDRWPMARVRDELHRLARGESGTVAAPAPAPVHPVAPPPEQSAPPLTAPLSHVDQGEAPSSRRRVMIFGSVLALVGLLAVLVWRWPSDEQAPSSDPTPPPPVSISPTPEPSPDEEPRDQEEVRAEMDAFIRGYLDQVVGQPRQAFEKLTPEFQRQSGGYEGYIGWWGTVRSATVQSIESDPETLKVAYMVRYVMENGDRQTERISLQLVRRDESMLIAGEG